MQRLLTLILVFPLLTAFTAPPGPTDEGNRAFNSGDYYKAVDAYEKALADDPDKAEAHYNLGGAYFKKGEFDKALEQYQDAINHDPKMADAYYNAGDSLFRLGRYEEALKAFDQARALRKGDRDTEHNIKVTENRVKKKQDEEKKQQQQAGKEASKGKGQGQNKQGQAGGQGAEKRPSPPSGRGGGGEGSGGAPQMSDKDVQALLDRQAREEKQLRNYFRPGRKEGAGRESEIEQMLRGFGLKGAVERKVKPGAPYIEKDW